MCKREIRIKKTGQEEVAHEVRQSHRFREPDFCSFARVCAERGNSEEHIGKRRWGTRLGGERFPRRCGSDARGQVFLYPYSRKFRRSAVLWGAGETRGVR